jgi:putative FmdB family regulatory protein
MPTYEYRCNACHKEFEYQQKMADPDLVKCEACGEDKLEKLISWSAFQLKGGGWYKDLYASQTPEQQRQVAKDAVDKGIPPKQKDKEGGDSKGDAPAAASSESTAAAPAKTGGDSGSSGSGSSASGSSGGSSSSGGDSSSGSSGGSSSSGSAAKE